MQLQFLFINNSCTCMYELHSRLYYSEKLWVKILHLSQLIGQSYTLYLDVVGHLVWYSVVAIIRELKLLLSWFQGIYITILELD